MIPHQNLAVKPLSGAAPLVVTPAILAPVTLRPAPTCSPHTATVLLDNGACRIEWRGFVELVNGSLKAHGRVMVLSKLDGGSVVWLEVQIGGKARNYFLVRWEPIRQYLPSLYRRLIRFSLFKTIDTRRTGTVVLGRLVLAADGVSVTKTVEGMLVHYDAHHLDNADGTAFLGHSTLDNRREVLERKLRHLHRAEHRKKRSRSKPHFYEP